MCTSTKLGVGDPANVSFRPIWSNIFLGSSLSRARTRRAGPGWLPENGREKPFFDIPQKQMEQRQHADLPEVHRAAAAGCGGEQRQQSPSGGGGGGGGMVFSVKSPTAAPPHPQPPPPPKSVPAPQPPPSFEESKAHLIQPPNMSRRKSLAAQGNVQPGATGLRENRMLRHSYGE